MEKKLGMDASLKAFREENSLSQADMAMYLDVSKGVVSMAETGKRRLTSELNLKFSALFMRHEEGKKLFASLAEPEFLREMKSSHKEQLRITLQTQLDRCHAELEKLLQDFSDASKRYKEATNIIKTVMAQGIILKDLPGEPYEWNVLSILNNRAKKILQALKTEKIEFMQIRINSLRTEIATMEFMMNDNAWHLLEQDNSKEVEDGKVTILPVAAV